MPLTAQALGCPLPPADLADRAMPVRQLDLAVTPMWRIHRSIFGPIHYNRRSTGGHPYRFDAPNDEFGVLYASPSFAGCMAEAVFRDRFQGHSLPLLLDEEELTQRSISELGTTLGRPLRLADLPSRISISAWTIACCRPPTIGGRTCGAGRFTPRSRTSTASTSRRALPTSRASPSSTARR